MAGSACGEDTGTKTFGRGFMLACGNIGQRGWLVAWMYVGWEDADAAMSNRL